MPRKRTQSAILKSERTLEQKQAVNARSRRLADRRYRRQLKYHNPSNAKEHMAKKRAEMTDEEKQAAKEKKKRENAAHYLKYQQDILHKKMKKRAEDYIAKHGENSFWSDYPHRTIHLRKSLADGSPSAKVST
ncbi:hypothetical protein DFH05DRAFT_1464206 [Lentinula detonsa]|uniref:Uncharacterized protein n=1 Tax=Lentinula detonsa TaxID=2804962 RepID=A0A9W8NR18_9AGAR|nr:hypothetical protein DFH05DRAFT_1464206 [Lentinula detonsa]